jgi:hypothetical protein
LKESFKKMAKKEKKNAGNYRACLMLQCLSTSRRDGKGMKLKQTETGGGPAPRAGVSSSLVSSLRLVAALVLGVVREKMRTRWRPPVNGPGQSCLFTRSVALTFHFQWTSGAAGVLHVTFFLSLGALHPQPGAGGFLHSVFLLFFI